MGKVIGGGLPVGAFGGRADIMDQLAPEGPVYQAGTLSGNPLALAAGLAQLRELERINAWALLEERGAQLEQATRQALHATGRNWTFHRLGSMFCLFFCGEPVRNLQDARKSDTAAFAKFFQSCLDRGIYFAPSQFETGFISTAHSSEDLDRTAAAITDTLHNLS
jgi:glutamate-1-semialdehyde 2,1-aminomutase